tara:strand:+ start:6127 stop:6849 length:723 start_codon:yes stop_codon:yes gene_type:complete
MGKENKDRKDLRLEVWKESIKRIPKTRKVRMKPDNYGPGSKGYHEKANPDGGKVDLYAYGGKKSKGQRFSDLMSGKYGKKDKDGEKTREEWRKVAKEIGVNLNSESDVAQMIDHVMGMGRTKEEETVNPPSEPPATFTPSDAHQEARSDFEAKQNNPIPRMSDQPGVAGGTSDPMVDAIRHGDDLNDWYQRDTERLKAEAKLGAYEIGERTRFNANRFVGKMPELGDVGKLVENYSKDFK